MAPDYTWDSDIERMWEERGVTIVDDCVVRDIELSANGAGHEVTASVSQAPRKLRCRWLVDGTSRAALVKRRLGISRSSGLRTPQAPRCKTCV